jgi:hypothetical protein
VAAATLASDGMGTGSPARGGRASSPAVAAPRETAAVVYFGGRDSRSLTETLWAGLCRKGALRPSVCPCLTGYRGKQQNFRLSQEEKGMGWSRRSARRRQRCAGAKGRADG